MRVRDKIRRGWQTLAPSSATAQLNTTSAASQFNTTARRNKTARLGATTRLGATMRLRRDERGTQLVELAIVVPLMLMLVGATAEFGRFFYTYTTLSKATRVGARYQISQRPDAGFAEAKNLVVYGNTAGTGSPVVTGLTTANVQVLQTSAGGSVQTVTVKINGFGYQPVFDLGKLTKNASLSLAVNVAPSSTMRQLVQ